MTWMLIAETETNHHNEGYDSSSSTKQYSSERAATRAMVKCVTEDLFRALEYSSSPEGTYTKELGEQELAEASSEFEAAVLKKLHKKGYLLKDMVEHRTETDGHGGVYGTRYITIEYLKLWHNGAEVLYDHDYSCGMNDYCKSSYSIHESTVEPDPEYSDDESE